MLLRRAKDKEPQTDEFKDKEVMVSSQALEEPAEPVTHEVTVTPEELNILEEMREEQTNSEPPEVQPPTNPVERPPEASSMTAPELTEPKDDEAANPEATLPAIPVEAEQSLTTPAPSPSLLQEHERASELEAEALKEGPESMVPPPQLENGLKSPLVSPLEVDKGSKIALNQPHHDEERFLKRRQRRRDEDRRENLLQLASSSRPGTHSPPYGSSGGDLYKALKEVHTPNFNTLEAESGLFQEHGKAVHTHADSALARHKSLSPARVGTPHPWNPPYWRAEKSASPNVTQAAKEEFTSETAKLTQDLLELKMRRLGRQRPKGATSSPKDRAAELRDWLQSPSPLQCDVSVFDEIPDMAPAVTSPSEEPSAGVFVGIPDMGADAAPAVAPPSDEFSAGVFVGIPDTGAHNCSADAESGGNALKPSLGSNVSNDLPKTESACSERDPDREIHGSVNSEILETVDEISDVARQLARLRKKRILGRKLAGAGKK